MPGVSTPNGTSGSRRLGADDVISVSDSDITEALAEWSAEFSRAEQSQGSDHRGLLQSAIHRGISGLRAVNDDDHSDKPNDIVRGEWELPRPGQDGRASRHGATTG